MDNSKARPVVVCLAGYFKGNEFIRECRRRGARVYLVTREGKLSEDWAHDSISRIVSVPDDSGMEEFLHATCEIAKSDKPDRIVALEESDVITAARARELLCVPGMNSSTALGFRDKLAMRVKAREADILQPDFVHLLNYQEVGEFQERVQPPWLIKPRADASSIGIRKLNHIDEVWREKDLLDARSAPRERSSYYLLESWVEGSVFHVNSLVIDGEPAFANVSRYVHSPLEVVQRGGVSLSHTVEYGSDDEIRLLNANRKLVAGLGMNRGTTHAEFIKGALDGRFYFLEIGARVGGAYTVESVEAATGMNLWREWAGLELSDFGKPYQLPEARKGHSGIAVSLARQKCPDTAGYTDPEIVFRVRKDHHVGLVVKSTDLSRVKDLLASYERRFLVEFTAAAPQQDRP